MRPEIDDAQRNDMERRLRAAFPDCGIYYNAWGNRPGEWEITQPAPTEPGKLTRRIKSVFITLEPESGHWLVQTGPRECVESIDDAVTGLVDMMKTAQPYPIGH